MLWPVFFSYKVKGNIYPLYPCCSGNVVTGMWMDANKNGKQDPDEPCQVIGNECWDTQTDKMHDAPCCDDEICGGAKECDAKVPGECVSKKTACNSNCELICNSDCGGGSVECKGKSPHYGGVCKEVYKCEGNCNRRIEYYECTLCDCEYKGTYAVLNCEYGTSCYNGQCVNNVYCGYSDTSPCSSSICGKKRDPLLCNGAGTCNLDAGDEYCVYDNGWKWSSTKPNNFCCKDEDCETWFKCDNSTWRCYTSCSSDDQCKGIGANQAKCYCGWCALGFTSLACPDGQCCNRGYGGSGIGSCVPKGTIYNERYLCDPPDWNFEESNTSPKNESKNLLEVIYSFFASLLSKFFFQS
jgi:hypothetical protein